MCCEILDVARCIIISAIYSLLLWFNFFYLIFGVNGSETTCLNVPWGKQGRRASGGELFEKDVDNPRRTIRGNAYSICMNANKNTTYKNVTPLIVPRKIQNCRCFLREREGKMWVCENPNPDIDFEVSSFGFFFLFYEKAKESESLIGK